MGAVLTQERLKGLLKYDMHTGVFSWLVGLARRVKIGDTAGYLDKRGYTRIKIDGKNYLSHRLVWLYHYGIFPAGQIDHINGKRSDNKLNNIRDCTAHENMRNRGMQSNNTSGVTGVKLTKAHLKDGKIDKYWTAHWYDATGKFVLKHFSIYENGYERAKELAIAYRYDRIQYLLTCGVVYTERHGVGE